jgi:hypothetical protein
VFGTLCKADLEGPAGGEVGSRDRETEGPSREGWDTTDRWSPAEDPAWENSDCLGVDGKLVGGEGKAESDTTVSKLIAEAAIPEIPEGVCRCLLAPSACLSCCIELNFALVLVQQAHQ